jgi:hypothetical protein
MIKNQLAGKTIQQTMNFSPDISLIIECCKTTPNAALVQELLERINDWAAFEELSYAHGVFPLVYATLKLHGANVPNAVIQSMKSHNMDIAKQNMLMSTELIKVMKLLEANAIEAIAFKGPALAQQAYGNITLRQYVDLDILVDEADLQRALNALKTQEYTLDEALFQKVIDAPSIFHDVTLSAKNSIQIELHWKLFSDEFQTNIETLNIKENLDEVELLNHKLKSFQKEVLILYLSIHGAKHNWERVEWLVDIVRFIEKNGIDWEKLTELMHKTRTSKIMLSTLYLCHKVLGFELPSSISQALAQTQILKLSKDFEALFYHRFRDSLDVKVQTKVISKIQYDILEGYKSKLLFIASLLKPTDIDFQSISLPKPLHFLYYFLRPLNILKRWFRKL